MRSLLPFKLLPPGRLLAGIAAAFIGLSATGYGQTEYVNETLRNGSLPVGWSQSNVTFTTATGGYANFTNTSAVLTTPIFDASSHTSVTVEFTVAKFEIGTDGPITVEYSINGGDDWEVAGDSPTPTSSTYLSANITIPTSSAAFAVRFTTANSPSAKRLRDVVISDGVIPFELVSLSPLLGANGVPTSTTLALTFNQPVQAGLGEVILYQGPSIVETFSASAGSFIGDTVTFTPSAPLNNSVSYHVIVEATAFEDLDGIPFAGLTLDTDWTFTTVFNGYIVDFEGVGETKGTYPSGMVSLSGLDWNLTEVMIGTAANDFKNGARSARLRAYDGAAMTMLEDKTNGAGSISFSYRRYGTDGSQQPWRVEYTTNAGVDWTPVGSTFTGTADVQTFSEYVNVDGDIRFRIILTTTPGTSGDRRLNIDDIVITDFGTDPLGIVSRSPANGMIDVLVNTSLSITFNKSIQAGTGSLAVYVAENDTLFEDITITSSMIVDDTLTVSLTDSLDELTNYYVLITAGAVESIDSETFTGFTDPSDWTFTTVFNGYIVDFEGVGETKGTYPSGMVSLSGLDWDLTQVLIGGSQPADFKNGARSARLRGYGTSAMTMLEDKTGGAGTISFKYRRYGADAQVAWLVEYSTNGGFDWTQVGSAFTATDNDDVQTFSESVNVTGDVRFRIRQDGSALEVNSRLNIDDIVITDLGELPALEIVTLSPSNGAVVVAIDTDLVVNFNQSIQVGSGNLVVYSSPGDDLVESIAITSGMISGNTLTISLSASFAENTAFYVLIDAGAVENSDASPFAGITVSSEWAFSTMGTPPPADDFAAWIAGYPGVGALTGSFDDADGDGIPNIMEHVLGFAPDVANKGSVLTTSGSAPGSISFVHTRIKPADLASDVVQGYEWSTNLADWAADGASLGGVTVAFGAPVVTDDTDPVFDVVEVTATVTAGSAERLFVRLTGSLAE